MRIMLVVNEFPPEKIAGTAMATRALAEHLSARGHRVLVLVTTACPEKKRHLIEEGDYRLEWMGTRPFRGIGVLFRLWRAWRAARCFKPQIIQGQAVSCGLIAAVVGKVLGIPSLCYAQGYDVYESGRVQRCTEIRWGCRWPDVCLAVTRQLAGEIRRIAGLNEVKVVPHAFTLPDGLPDRLAARARVGLDADKKLVLSVGRLEAFKGHDVLLEAWRMVIERHPDARLWIAGSGSRLDDLRAQAVKMGVEKSVSFVGHLTARAVHEAMAAADVFVLPSRSEPFGIVLLEAMAHGLPVVASRVGGIPEVVPESGDVELVASDNVQALAAAILTMLDKGFAPSEANRQHAMSFEWGRRVAVFETIYQSLIKAPRREGRNLL